MANDGSSAGETRAWLEKAKADLVSAKILIEAKDPSQLHQVLFHSRSNAHGATSVRTIGRYKARLVAACSMGLRYKT